MATAGQLKAKIDVLRKKIEEKGASLALPRRRQLSKRLKRLQRARRVAATADKKRQAEKSKKGQPAAAPEAPAGA